MLNEMKENVKGTFELYILRHGMKQNLYNLCYIVSAANWELYKSFWTAMKF